MNYEEQNDSFEAEVQQKPSLTETIEALRAEKAVASRVVYYGLAHLDTYEIASLKPVWASLSDEYRSRLLTDLTEASELNFELDYHSLGVLSLDDPEPSVRAAAIDLLWEDQTSELLSKLVDMAQFDDSSSVRAAAASALGRFILLGEYEELPERETMLAQDTVINLLTNDDEEVEVRRRALEAIANSSHEIVHDAILDAYEGPEHLMKISSVFAMGRSCDREWEGAVLREIGSPDAEIRYEAAKAAGELELKAAIPALGRIAAYDDREIREVAVWSLGEIGGREATRILTALAEEAQASEDTGFLEAVEEAIGNASLIGDILEFEEEDE